MSMWDGFNQRKFPRVNLQCEILIRAEDLAAPLSTVTENVGAGGVCVILDKALERFSKCRIRLYLDEKKPSIDCNGKVVWAVPTQALKSAKKRFDTGIEFLDLDAPSAQRIRDFIEAHVHPKG